MPLRPQRPCRASGCRSLHRNATGYCDAHADLATLFVRNKAREAARVATQEKPRRGALPLAGMATSGSRPALGTWPSILCALDARLAGS